MKVLVIKPEKEIDALRAQLILKRHGIDYGVYSITDLTNDEIDEIEETKNEELKQVTLGTGESKIKEAPAENSTESVSLYADLANVNDEPENLGQDFLRAQLSTKNQMKIRNVLAIISAVAVVIAFTLEKLGVL